MKFQTILAAYDTLRQDEKLSLFDDLAWTLGFSSLTASQPKEAYDLEASLLFMGVLISERPLRLGRFLPVLFLWLSNYSKFINAQKITKMMTAYDEIHQTESCYALELMKRYLRFHEPKRYKTALKIRPIKEAFYLDQRMKELVDMALELEGFPEWLDVHSGYMMPKSTFHTKSMDVLSEKVLFDRNEQFRLRLLMGVCYRADALWMLKREPALTPTQLAAECFMSYEPAHRLLHELRTYQLYEIGAVS